MLDVLIAGGGPAGAIAGLVLARAGARVLIVDRDTFPRDKLCGDTLNPGALAFLSMLGLTGGPLDAARPLAGMVVSNPTVSIRARYGDGVVGRAIVRRVLDQWLLDQAIAAGARFESGLVVRAPLVDSIGGRPVVRGLIMDRRGQSGPALRVPALLTLAADGRRSVLARSVGLTAHPARPRRWAFGTYVEDVAGNSDLGEMHIRPSGYLGIAPITDSVSNVCVVTGPGPAGPTPLDVIRRAVAADVTLTERFANARYASRVSVLGPLAVDARGAGVDGLLLAGDAAGFVDPMTGDGLHLAMRGAWLAADEALRVLAKGDLTGAASRLAEARREDLGAKLRFNRVIRRLVDSPVALRVAGWGADLAPGVLGRLVRYAGDAA